jgi:uncharacterized membrane protein YcjF (UPF0283 family)
MQSVKLGNGGSIRLLDVVILELEFCGSVAVFVARRSTIISDVLVNI